MEKLYKLKNDVLKYINIGIDKNLKLTMNEWINKGYTTEALEETFESPFVLGVEQGNRTSICEWRDNISKMYFTLRINQEFREHQILCENKSFIDRLILNMNKSYNKTYNQFIHISNK